MTTGGAWWQTGVLYQIYPRSFADSNGDGIGDLRGIIGKLDHLEWLGIDGVWLSPIHPSPNADWGYDVADYYGVHPELGTLADVDELVAEGARRGIRILLDLVPNHSSNEHPWFLESRSSRESPRRDWYVWADPKPDGSPPNNWTAFFGGGPAWTYDEGTGQWYMHNFQAAQPDFNWWNEEVRAAFDDVLRFWFERGIAGFRIDVANALIKDRELRDNPPARPEGNPWEKGHGQAVVYNANRPEVHEIFRGWRALADEVGGERALVGEAWVWDVERWAAFWGNGADELHLAFLFHLLDADFEADALRAAVEAAEAVLPPGGWPALAASNHDVVRFPTRWCGGDEALVRCALLVLLTLRGTPFLYYGDELGMRSVDVPDARVLDCADPSRDPGRTPMQWSPDPGAGFTEAGVEPWLPLGDAAARNVADQRADPDSTLSFARELIAFRRRTPDLREGDYRTLEAPDGAWAWRRGGGTTVAVNLSAANVELAGLAGLAGTIAFSTDRSRTGEPISGALSLRAAEGVVLT